jgi:hypothetical protein
MNKTFTFLVLFLVLACAFRQPVPAFSDQPFPVNSTVAYFFLPDAREKAWDVEADYAVSTDSTDIPHFLMFNYCAYDSAYAAKMMRLVRSRYPEAILEEFNGGSPADLSAALKEADAVLIGYATTAPANLKQYGTLLKRYVQQGGNVVLTGTHEYGTLQQLGLFDIDFGYYCNGTTVNTIAASHPLMSGLPGQFTPDDYAYPLDISDPAFVTVAEVRGYPVVGYKLYGTGKIAYLGLEYYHTEASSVQLLYNALRWAAPAPVSTTPSASFSARSVRRQEEILIAGSGSKGPRINMKVYPNPFYEKATLDIEIEKPTSIHLFITDELGRVTNVLLPRRTLSAGLYRFEMPNLPNGVYFVQCFTGDKSEVKKVVKRQG